MKKIVLLILVICLSLTPVLSFADNISIIIDGENAEIPEGMGKIVEIDGRTMVPVRFLLEYFKFGVAYEDSTQTVLGMNNDNDMMLMQIGSTSLFLNKDMIQMDVAPFLNLEEGRTYVPLRFLAEGLGYKVEWDEASYTVTLTKSAE